MRKRRAILPGVRRKMDAFSEVLNRVRLKGAMFFRAEFSAPWTLDAPLSRVGINPGGGGAGLRVDEPDQSQRDRCSFHLRSIYEKLQVHSKSEVVGKALRQRLV